MADCLNNEQQINSNLSESNVDALTSNLDGGSSVNSEISGESSISSTMYSEDNTASNLGSEEPLDSKLDLPTTYTYYGSDGDNITVTVDNEGFIISATVKPIMYDSFSLFPKIGSERLIYVDRQTKSLYAYNSRNQSYFKLVADTKPIYSGLSGSEFSMNPNGVAVVKVDNFPYTSFSSIPNGTILEVQFLNPYVDAINEYPLYLQINDMDSLRVLVTQGTSDTYYNPVTMGGWKANDMLRFVKGRSWMLTMISGRIVNGVVAEAQYSQKAGKDSSGNTFETYYAKETDVSTIRNQYLKSATVSDNVLTITNQSGSKIEFKGGSGESSSYDDTEIRQSISDLANNKTKIKSSNGGFAGGGSSIVNSGGAVGYSTMTDAGGAVGAYAYSTRGFAGGGGATTGDGVAIGYLAETIKTTEGSTEYIDAIQIGRGTNSKEKTFQVYDDNIYDANTHTLTVKNIELAGGTMTGDINFGEGTGLTGSATRPTYNDKNLALFNDIDTRQGTNVYVETYGGTTYYPLAKFTRAVDDGSNSTYVNIAGKIGGWSGSGGAYINVLLWGRGERAGSYIFSGNILEALNAQDIVMYEESSTSVVIYLKTVGYTNARLNIKSTASSGGTEIIYTGSTISTPTGTLIASMSNNTIKATSGQTVLLYDYQSSSSSLNWGKTAGIQGSVSVSGKDFSKYSFLRVTAFSYDTKFTYFIDLKRAGAKVWDSSYPYIGNGGLAMSPTSPLEEHYSLSCVNSAKTTFYHYKAGYVRVSDHTNNERNSNGSYYITKIEGVF